MPQNNNDDAGKLDKFHFFPELSPELQLLVWKLYREDQPVLYHFMSVTGQGRVYGARDPEKNELVTTTAQSANQDDEDGQALDPAEYKIRFVNKVKMGINLDQYVHPSHLGHNLTWLAGLVDEIATKTGQWKSTATTWVNFEKDIFFLSSTYHKPGQLRFLFQHYSKEDPEDIPGDSWAHRIRQLAMYFCDDSSLTDFDRHALGQLRGLRKVYLVINRNTWDTLNITLKSIDDSMAKYQQHAKQPISHKANRLIQRWTKARAIRDELRQIFQTANRCGIVIDIVSEGALPMLLPQNFG
ncbi:hypothetical protein GGR57DRAFT_513266 [Xylariaceae sp. FL1272]|nr:hypothetical protein GGR57DRAFT_513266 [Xylariaceae sp. FL1272]